MDDNDLAWIWFKKVCFLAIGCACIMFSLAWALNRVYPGTPSMLSDADAAAICDKAAEHCIYDAVYHLSCQQALENCELARGLK